MKVIDLLVKTANDEEVPKKIKITWIDYVEIYEYDEELNWYFRIDDGTRFSISTLVTLNTEIEIIEEDTTKGIKNLELCTFDKFKNMCPEERYFVTAKEYKKINEIIDKLNKEE